jgi:putative DNA-binding protein
VKSVTRSLGVERNLAASQNWLFERATRPVAAITGGATAEVSGWVVGGGLAPLDRLEIYRHGYFARLVECLADDYPAVAHALGAEAFELLCRDFIARHPPTSASLNFYGAPFADFCAARSEPLAAFVSDLARLEWAVVEAIHADGEMLLDPAALSGVSEADWPRLRLVASPTLRIIHSAYPIHRHYQAFLAEEDPSVPAPEASSLAVCRRGDDVWRIGLRPMFADLLGRLIEGMPLASALEAFEAAAPSDTPDAPAALQVAFSEWVACGFFASVIVS